MKKKIYLACGLTCLPKDEEEQFLELIEELKWFLHARFQLLEWVGTVAGTAELVYERDIEECVMTTDYMVALCDYPSTGLGDGLAVANLIRRIPILAFAHNRRRVTRLVLGIPNPNFTFRRYESINNIKELVSEQFLGTAITA
jgi:hypothetical protein